MSEAAGIFFAGVVFGGALFGVVGASYAWVYGYDAGELAEKKRRAAAEARLMDSIGEVL